MDEELDSLFGENDDLINSPTPPIDSDVFEELLPEGPGTNIEWGGVKQVGGIGGFGDSQFDQGATYKQVKEGRLNDRRANLQPWTDQVANMLGQAVVGEIVGGSIEGLGYVLDVGSMSDYITGQETEWGNWLTDIGQGIREGSEESLRIYEEKPGEMNMSDPGYWFKNGVSVASSLSMLLPSMAATKALGFLGKTASKGAGMMSKSMDLAAQMGTKATWMTEGVSQAVVSRHIENSMEAHGTFKDQKEKLLNSINKETGKNYTEEEATRGASEAAAYNYRHGWAMLLQDIPQYLALGRVFNPVSMKMENALSNATKKGITPKWKSGLKAGGVTFVSEGAEEGYQFFIAEKGKALSDLKAGLISQEEYDRRLNKALGTDEAKTSMLFGGLGGNLFQLAGKGANEVFKSKTRKEFEAKAGDNYNAGLQTRAKQISALQTQLAKADQSENEEYRRGALNTLLTETMINAINNNKLDQTIETLIAGPKMSEEELAAFEKEHGVAYNPELAKKYTPEILENANKIKKLHTKNLSKAENKNVPKHIVGNMTLKQFQSEEAIGFIQSLDKQYQEVLDQSPFTARNPSDYLDKKSRLNVNKKALKQAIAYNKKEAKATKDERLKNQYEALALDHEKTLAGFEKNIAELEESKKGRDAAQVTADSKAAKAHRNIESELVRNRAESLLLEDFITKNEDDLNFLRTPAAKKEFHKKAAVQAISQLQTEEEVTEATADFAKNEDFKEGTDKKEIEKALETRLQEIKAAAKKEEAKAVADKYKAEKEAEVKAKNKNSKLPDNNAINSVEESLEDENAGEEIDFETINQEEDAEHNSIKENGAKTISLLDAVSGTGAFQTWKHDGNSKIGQKVTYEISKKGQRTDKQKAAIKLFNENKDSKDMPQSVYDNLPIIAYVGEGKSIFTYMPSKPQYEGDQMERYINGTAGERKSIIDTMAAGKPAVTEIVATSGGELILETEDGLPIENSILDLQQIKSPEDVKLIYTNEDGKLIDIATKELNRDFAGKILSVGKDEKGNEMAYRGGLFVVLNKADGTRFPVRLNFQKNTEIQAETIADILIEVSVPNKKGEKKNIELSQPLSTVPDALQARIKEHLAPELAVLGKDPSMNEIINMFVYVSDKTKNMSSRLYWAGEHLNYGDDFAITPGNKTMGAERAKLVDFLTNKKRRQFSIKNWNDTEIGPAYRKFALESGIINTNVIANQPAFQTTDNEYTTKDGKTYKYRIQTYVKPLKIEKPQPIEKVAAVTGDKVLPAALQERIAKSEKVGNQINELGEPFALFFTAKFGRLVGKEMANMDAVTAAYQKEIDKIPAPRKVEVIPNDVESKPITEENVVPSSKPAKTKRKLKTAIKFKNQDKAIKKSEPTNNKNVNPFDEDNPAKIDKKCK